MLLFFINRAGHGLTPRRRAELLRAKRLMQQMIRARRQGVKGSGTRARRGG
jgi:hypothetical protein